MRKINLIVLGLFMASMIFPSKSFAIYNPRNVPNNIFGIHINNRNDIPDAATLVNSSGGDWGYVIFVIREDQMNVDEWNQFFNELSKYHLIPIVRIASHMNGNGWDPLSEEDVSEWVSFLNSLNWPVKNRYVVIGNEPNHATEWGGKVDPESYVQFLRSISTGLKRAHSDFFVLPAGLDASAPNVSGYMDETTFIQRMILEVPDLAQYIDGWTSHSYPNPDFSGSEHDTGRGSIRTYEWELDYLRKLGIAKDLPVFITETGWAHNQGVLGSLTNVKDLGFKYKYAYKNIWGADDRVVAVTPFLLQYTQYPFENFSWKDKDGKYYDFYYEITGDVYKVKGRPQMYEDYNDPIKIDYSRATIIRITQKEVKKPSKFDKINNIIERINKRIGQVQFAMS